MKPLEPPDSFLLLAAQGWLELGNHGEASEELDHISPRGSRYPDVQQCRWEIYAAERKWGASLAVADFLIMWADKDPRSWLRRT